MKEIKRPGGKHFARNGKGKWHLVYPVSVGRGSEHGYGSPCNFQVGDRTEYNNDSTKPANEVCKNCRIYAFHWGWSNE